MSKTTENKISETYSNCRPSTNISNNITNDLPKSTKSNTFSGKSHKSTNENTGHILEKLDEQNPCDILRDLKLKNINRLVIGNLKKLINYSRSY